MSRARRVLLAVLAATAALLAVLLIRAATLSPAERQAPPLPAIEIDEQQLARTLSEAIKLKTIVEGDDVYPREEFTKLHELLARSFPRVHSTLTLERVSDLSLLYTWKGEDPDAKPIALLAHQDVVPVDPATLDQWEQPPFSGTIADGYVWGRGAIDDKNSVISVLAAVEHLLGEGYKPRRTVYLALGHDEEVGGPHGAKQIAALLRERDVRLEFVLDEGMLIVSGSIPGISRPIAFIGIGEKASLSVEITGRGEGGHGSTPARDSVLTRLSTAALRLRDNQLPLRVSAPLNEMFTALAPEMNFGTRIVFANRWLFDPLILRLLDQQRVSGAMVRTTTAQTVLNTGVKRNVLPSSGRLVVNFRLLPGDTREQIFEHVRGLVDDLDLEVNTLGENPPAPTTSGTDTRSYGVVRDAIAQVFPDAVIAPGLLLGATDSANFADITDAIYRFNPVRLTREDISRFHGVNERVAIDNLGEGVRFHVQVLREGAS